MYRQRVAASVVVDKDLSVDGSGEAVGVDTADEDREDEAEEDGGGEEADGENGRVILWCRYRYWTAA